MKNLSEYIKSNKTLIISLVLSLVLIIGVSWAYFAPHTDVGENANINVTSEYVEEFRLTVDKDILLHINQQTVPEHGDNYGDTAVARASFKPGDNGDTTKSYYVYFNIKQNEYQYTTSEEKTELLLKIKGPEGDIKSLGDLKYDSELQGFDVTMENGLIKVAGPYEITNESKYEYVNQDWTFTLTFINLDTNQSDNSEKIFDAQIIIQKDEINNDLAYVCKASDCLDSVLPST